MLADKYLDLRICACICGLFRSPYDNVKALSLHRQHLPSATKHAMMPLAFTSKEMSMPDTPELFLQRAITLLTGTRGLGNADRVREGNEPYSSELDFRGVDEATAQGKIAWASDQAPWAQFEIVPAPTATGTLTVFVAVELQKLASYLVERVLQEEKNQTWQTATGALPELARKDIDETVGGGETWQSLVSRLKLNEAALDVFWSTLMADLQAQQSMLHKIVQAVETGEYL
jgi:hypothetical protein